MLTFADPSKPLLAHKKAAFLMSGLFFYTSDAAAFSSIHLLRPQPGITCFSLW